MYAIMGYGSPRFSLGDQSVHFSGKNPAGTVEWEPVEEFYETLGGDSIPRFKGYRVKVTLTLYNMRSTDYLDHLKLMNIINASRSQRVPILLQPRFSSGITLDLRVWAKGAFGHKEITNLNAGQKLDISFESKSLVTDLPLIVNRPSFLMLDATSYLLLNADGSKLIIPQREIEPIVIDTSYEA